MKHKPILVEWQDAASIVRHWEARGDVLKEAKHFEQYLITTVGLLLEETKEYLLICLEMDNQWHDNGPNVDHVLQIPRSAVRKRRFLK